MQGVGLDAYDNYWSGNAGESNSPDMIWQGPMSSYGSVQPTVKILLIKINI